ncbi:MAG: 3-hydroxyacyl-CoA dehydrogenase NAD-binding domain-containing protein [Bdellovibrionaceae bacterium]|nr:3-hydroxyacyl-CoA dehydrogenase NAD-binding domain-containing protein [Pseudobdellovibrionaceae bacterium]
MKQLKFSIKEGSIGWLEWNNPELTVNLISSSFLKELSEVIKKIESSQIKALVFVSQKENNFCAGADIKEIQNMKNPEQIRLVLESAHLVFSEFEKLNFTKICTIDGACLGGGLEWALCFDYRLVSADPNTKLGFPEVQLGLIPGLGGCIRLPKLVGLKKALELILTGKSVSSRKAVSIGLAHENVPSLVLKKRALQLAQQIIEGKAPFNPVNKYKNKKPFFYWMEFFFKSLICLVFKKKSLEKTKGFYPAPLKAIELIKKTYYYPISDKLLKKEMSVFTQLLQTPESKNLIRLWLLMDSAKKINTVSTNYKPIKKIAIIGAGTMGQSIAYLMADKGFQVRLIDNKLEALCESLKKTRKLFEKQKRLRKINSYELENRFNNLSVSQNFSGIKTIDLIIEALPEDLILKQKIIKEVSKKAKPECFFASNTSSLSILDLAKSSMFPSHFFGLHFFNPAHRMPLLEVFIKEDQRETYPQILQFIKKLGKVPLFVKDSPGFVVNRILVAYFSECLNLFEEGYEIESLDSILTNQLGMPLGPFELMDKIGLDICLQTIFHLEEKGIFFKRPGWLKTLTVVLGKGEKSKEGFYNYKEKIKIVNPKINSLKREKRTDFMTDKQLIQRIINRMAVEGKTLIQNKIVQKEEDIDLALALGAGFPAFLGGPMLYSKKEKDLL